MAAAALAAVDLILAKNGDAAQGVEALAAMNSPLGLPLHKSGRI